jgi:hypothetical protein
MVRIAVQRSYCTIQIRGNRTRRDRDASAGSQYPTRLTVPHDHGHEMSNEPVSPRVNGARLKDFIGASHPIRFPGKVLSVRAPIVLSCAVMSDNVPSPLRSLPMTRRTCLWRPPMVAK